VKNRATLVTQDCIRMPQGAAESSNAAVATGSAA